MPAAVRLCLDVNVWLAYLLSESRGRTGTASHALVQMVSDMRAGPVPLQLVVPSAILMTLQDVAIRKGVAMDKIAQLTDAIIEIALWGPERLDPFLFFGAETLQVKDSEDAGVLAGALSAKADFLITDNLVDFENKDASIYDTQIIRVGQRARQLSAIIHEHPNGATVVVAHPYDFLDWVRRGVDLAPGMVRSNYPRRSAASAATTGSRRDPGSSQ